MAKIIIESNGDTTFRFKKYPDEEFQIKAKIFEIKKIENTSEVYTVKATQANTGELLFSEKISDITVDGAVYTNYEDLSEVLTPLLFKKGGGSGGGGTGGTVNVTSPITGDGDATPIGILPASSSNRGTISSSDFNKLAAFQAASNYALQTDLSALDVSIKDWVEDKSYTTLSEVAASYYNKTEIDGKLSSTYKAKGNVANFAALPASGNTYGDVYNLLDTGDNYVWIQNYNNTGSPGWDKLSGLVDLSNYYTKSETESTITAKGYATTSSVNTAIELKLNKPISPDNISERLINADGTTSPKGNFERTLYLNITLPAIAQESWKGLIIYFSGTGVLTIPNTLSDGWTINGITEISCNLSATITGANVWAFDAPSTIFQKQIFTITKKVNSIYLLGF